MINLTVMAHVLGDTAIVVGQQSTGSDFIELGGDLTVFFADPADLLRLRDAITAAEQARGQREPPVPV